MLEIVSNYFNKELKSYLKKGNHQVQGWLEPMAMHGIVALSALQLEHNIKGAAGEIGIHHGRLFILLHLLAQSGECSVAWDLFENQAENQGHSGRGDREQFVANLQSHHCDIDRIRIETVNSIKLTTDLILSHSQQTFRLFSVDGGHTAEITFHDLQLASSVLCKGGLVILDDFFNEAWPGVSEGCMRFMLAHPGALVPVAIFGNKFVFTNDVAFANACQDTLFGLDSRVARGYSVFFDQTVVTLVPDHTSRLRHYIARHPWWRSVQDTPVGIWIKRSWLARLVR